MKRKTLLAGLTVAGLALAGCQKKAGSGPTVTQGADGSKSVQAIGMTLEWKFDGSDVQFHVTTPSKGWIGVGFDPSTIMRGANFILVYVKDGQAYGTDQYGSQLTNHEPDTALGGQDNVTVVSGTETSSGTEVTFRIPVDSGDQYDKVLSPGTEHTILLAYSDADDFETQHKPDARTKVKVTL
jgi:hypothetical protein